MTHNTGNYQQNSNNNNNNDDDNDNDLLKNNIYIDFCFS